MSISSTSPMPKYNHKDAYLHGRLRRSNSNHIPDATNPSGEGRRPILRIDGLRHSR